MNDLLTQFLHPMPTIEEWLLFVMSSLFSFVAAHNTVLRRERRQEQRQLAYERRGIERERKLYLDEYNQKAKRVDEQWSMIQQQSNQIYDLNQQVFKLTIKLGAAKQIHLNLN